MIHRHRGNRRYQTYKKAARKKRIITDLQDCWYVKHFGMLRKGKIHCSCPMCAEKSNDRLSKSKGPVSSVFFEGMKSACIRGSRIPTTNRRYGKKNYTVSECRSIDSMRQQLREL